MKWFSIAGIRSEIRRIRWPRFKDLAKDTGVVLAFTIAFGLFFVLCEVVASTFLKFVGM